MFHERAAFHATDRDARVCLPLLTLECNVSLLRSSHTPEPQVLLETHATHTEDTAAGCGSRSLTMLLIHQTALEALALFTLFETVLTFRLPAAIPRHGLLDQLKKRQVVPATTELLSILPVPTSVSSTGAQTTYTFITPSPSASPIAITSQSQVVTTFVPMVTLCPMSGQEGAPNGAVLSARSCVNDSPAPYQNVTAARSPGCVTKYMASRTTVCDTTLMGIASQVHVTECDQDITFSSLYGYSLSTIAPSDTTETGPPPTIETITTYFQAPWQSLTDGMTPTDVTQRVCSPVPTNSEQCIDIQEVWETVSISTVKTTSTEVSLVTRSYL